MLFNVGDLVTRNSYNNDIVFKIIEFENDKVILQGINVRLIADSKIDDLKKCEECYDKILDDAEAYNRAKNEELDRGEYFYMPGKILHIDADEDYLKRCMEFYKKMNILAYGVLLNEKIMHLNIRKKLEEVMPDIVVITGHDAYNKKNEDVQNNVNYKNSDNFVKAVREARKYEKSHEKLVIIAGACQSNYEELIKSGSNFASSPKRINIHALDPAVIASSISLSNKGKEIDLLKILNKTKYGSSGMGGIITEGMMYMGYPR